MMQHSNIANCRTLVVASALTIKNKELRCPTDQTLQSLQRPLIAGRIREEGKVVKGGIPLAGSRRGR
eukprot:scaffold185413_cov20-Prasinocladus_malaysianus.AAC.1